MATILDLESEQERETIFRMSFGELCADARMRAFGVDYARVRTAAGGDLFVTPYGWPHLRSLLPENWYANQWFVQAGERQAGATGHVYRVPSRLVQGIDLLVKFSRVGQEVPLQLATSFPEGAVPPDQADARFNSPWEEFGLVMELRRGDYGPPVTLRAQRPLAIYAPPEQFDLWRLGRSACRFDLHQRQLAEDQEDRENACDLDIRRDYVLLYSWIKGIDAEQAFLRGWVPEAELKALTHRVIGELETKGFRVLDNKPKHFIVRQPQRGGPVLRRAGQIAYGLVDFELLQRTAEYQRQFHFVQRARYWALQNHRLDAPAAPLPAHLRPMRIFGVPYLYGTAPNGGGLWTVGNVPEVFDYFLPDRWRRTPRVKLALTHEVYRTRTRDHIHIIYRRSRVGERPAADPFYPQGKRVRAFGHNSPFEEAAIAEYLRAVGLPTIYPRAVYRTGHESIRAIYLRDESRYLSHARFVTPGPDPQPVLSPRHDYYTIWGEFRGVDPHRAYRPVGHWGFIDVRKALDDQLISPEEHNTVIGSARARLGRFGLTHKVLEEYELLLLFDEEGRLRRDPAGAFETLLCMDALTAHDFALLDEATYRRLIERTRSRLSAVGCEALNLSGNHLLLAMIPDGVLRTDAEGEVEITICNFEMIACPAILVPGGETPTPGRESASPRDA
jgi:hypothetical protein